MDLIEDILTPNRVHLLGGASDVGKTRWLLPMLMDWEKGRDVLGRKSHPVPWAYISGDRIQLEVHETLTKLGIPIAAVRVIPASGFHHKDWLAAFQAAAELRPVPQLLVVEGFSQMAGDKRFEVYEFLEDMLAWCQPSVQFPAGLTILGVVESPKQKPYERYPNPRQRIAGSSLWGYKASTILLIESTKADPEMLTGNRVFYCCPKNAQRRQLNAIFDAQGRLIVP